MKNRSTLAAVLAFALLSTAQAADYFVVVPNKGRTSSADNITVSLNNYALPAGSVGVPYSAFDMASLLSVTGDPAFSRSNVKWQLTSGNLPAGLALSADGVLSGTPSAGGTSTFELQAVYKTKNGKQTYQVLVGSLTIGLQGATPPDAVVGVAYTYDLKPLLDVAGDPAFNSASATWSVVDNTLPDGLTLMTDGTIAGTPTTPGSGSVTARATYKGAHGDQTYQIVTLNLDVTLGPVTLPEAKLNVAYAPYDFKNRLTVFGEPNYNPSLAKFTATNLPDGFSMAEDGVLTGTPTVKNTTGTAAVVRASYKGKAGEQTYTIVVNGLTLDAVQVSTGFNHTCAVTPAGGVKCWGNNGSGQLGNGTFINAYSPMDVTGLKSGVVSVYAGTNFTCALTTATTVKCWGINSSGQLGNNSTTNSRLPVSVLGIGGVSKLAVGGGSSCVRLSATGGIKCWGSNTAGQLGNNSAATYSAVAVDVAGLTDNTSALVAGSSHYCVLVNGGVKCWGQNIAGNLGNGNQTNSKVPVDVPGLSSGVTAVYAGATSSCAATQEGMKCWGGNSGNQFGSIGSSILNPIDMPVLNGVSSFSMGTNSICAIMPSGLKCWGLNSVGQLGNGVTGGSSSEPVDVLGFAAAATQVSVGSQSACAVTPSNRVQCWGANASGQLGDGTTNASPTPVDVRTP